MAGREGMGQKEVLRELVPQGKDAAETAVLEGNGRYRYWTKASKPESLVFWRNPLCILFIYLRTSLITLGTSSRILFQSLNTL
jgi:hypothetical protein